MYELEIARLLTAQKIEATEFYNMLVTKGGAFSKKNRSGFEILTGALMIDDQEKTVTVGNDKSLLELVKYYQITGSDKANLIIALIIFHERQKPNGSLFLVMNLLCKLCEAYKNKKDTLPKLKMDFYSGLEQIYKAYEAYAGIILTKDLADIRPFDSDSEYDCFSVKYRGAEYFLKKVVYDSRAELEVFCAELFRFLQGEYQPRYYIVKDFSADPGSSAASVMSEFMDYRPFALPEVQQYYRQHGFAPFAAMAVYCLALAENDLHRYNFGVRVLPDGSWVPVRIDFNECLFLLTYKQSESGPKTLGVYDHADNFYVEIKEGIDRTAGFGISAKSLSELPHLRVDLGFGQHFVPSLWPTYTKGEPNELIREFNTAGKTKAYQDQTHRAILNFCLLPDQLIERIAAKITDVDTRASAIALVKERRQSLHRAVIKMPEFIEFLRQDGKAVRDRCLAEAQAFFDGNPEYHHIASKTRRDQQLSDTYHAAFGQLCKTVIIERCATLSASDLRMINIYGDSHSHISGKINSVSLRRSASFAEGDRQPGFFSKANSLSNDPDFNPPVQQLYQKLRKYNNFLGMGLGVAKNYVSQQKVDILTDIKTFDYLQLIFLFERMKRVNENSAITNHPFKWIRADLSAWHEVLIAIQTELRTKIAVVALSEDEKKRIAPLLALVVNKDSDRSVESMLTGISLRTRTNR